MTVDALTIGRRLRTRREAVGLTREALSAESGVHVETIRNYEVSRRAPMLLAVARLAESLDMSLDELVSAEIAPRAAPIGEELR